MEQKVNETRIDFLLRLLENLVENSGASDYKMEYDGTICDGTCLVDDIKSEFGILMLELRDLASGQPPLQKVVPQFSKELFGGTIEMMMEPLPPLDDMGSHSKLAMLHMEKAKEKAASASLGVSYGPQYTGFSAQMMDDLKKLGVVGVEKTMHDMSLNFKMGSGQTIKLSENFIAMSLPHRVLEKIKDLKIKYDVKKTKTWQEILEGEEDVDTFAQHPLLKPAVTVNVPTLKELEEQSKSLDYKTILEFDDLPEENKGEIMGVDFADDKDETKFCTTKVKLHGK